MVKPDDPTKNLTGNDRYMGYCVDLAEHIAKVVNITYEFRVVKDNKFGTQRKITNHKSLKTIAEKLTIFTV